MLSESAPGAVGTVDGEDPDEVVDLFGFTGRWLALAHRAMRAELDRRLHELGGSLATFQVLRVADTAGSPTQVELAEALGITGSTLVRHLDRMAAAGLVERRIEGADRRLRRIVVTPAGQSALHRMTAVAVQSERAVAALLSEDELAALRHALQTLAGHFGAADAHVHAAQG